ncbi:hypothetical protein COLO4_06108 [Corchorus olitorius]|uniref:Uncharacterized protein n=1 Tax=Corchorus olitorius TaxID=93759 RepID=A0A1R3KP68_9ROSI|nr:hypothetical protein COLO4_06108 [Corchorus olitorius]
MNHAAVSEVPSSPDKAQTLWDASLQCSESGSGHAELANQTPLRSFRDPSETAMSW